MKSVFNDELKHHGIVGQKWGVRRGPPYPIEDTIMRKGTRLRHIDVSKNGAYVTSGKKWLYTYNLNDSWDDDVYKGPFSMYLRERSFGYLGPDTASLLNVYAHDLEVTRDLKMPTKQERFSNFQKVFDKNKKVSIDELKRVQDVLKRHEIGSKESRALDLANVKTENDYKLAYEIFNHAMESKDSFSITRKYAQAMSKKYDAMVDDNNQGIYNRAHDPVVIFNAKKFVKSVGMLSVNSDDTEASYKRVKKELSSKGEKVKL